MLWETGSISPGAVPRVCLPTTTWTSSSPQNIGSGDRNKTTPWEPWQLCPSRDQMHFLSEHLQTSTSKLKTSKNNQPNQKKTNRLLATITFICHLRKSLAVRTTTRPTWPVSKQPHGGPSHTRGLLALPAGPCRSKTCKVWKSHVNFIAPPFARCMIIMIEITWNNLTLIKLYCIAFFKNRLMSAISSIGPKQCPALDKSILP